ncbi:unnamed protein product [Oreochromis niloticus]|nr:unnamed protein product [Mustela putorius furo]
MAWFRNKSSTSPYSTLDMKVDRNESKTTTENEDSFRSLSEHAEGDVSEGQHEADESQEPESRVTGPKEEEEEFDSREYRVHTTDEFYCDYDSTWETDPNEESPPSRIRQTTNSNYYKFSRFECAARDMQNFRHDYPNQIKTQHRKKNTNDDKPNLNFYLGKKRSVPDGVYITDIHEKWYGDYERLEYVQTYIQWLFPLQEPGVNYEASTLTKEEITDFLNHSIAKENLLKSYKLMLDFYGIVLCDEKTGKVTRAEHWEERFHNLNSHTHNNLRITRILKCLGNLGYPHYQAPLVHFFLEETLVNGQLPNIRDSVLSYFMFAVLNKTQRRNLIKYAYSNYEPKDEFVWCPKKIQKLWSMQSKAAKEDAADSLGSQEDTLISDSEAQEEENLSADELCRIV